MQFIVVNKSNPLAFNSFFILTTFYKLHKLKFKSKMDKHIC
jgi:hypothetical protein